MTPDPAVVTPLLQYGALGLVALLMVIWAALLWKFIDKLDARLGQIDKNVDDTRHAVNNNLTTVHGELAELRLDLARSGHIRHG